VPKGETNGGAKYVVSFPMKTMMWVAPTFPGIYSSEINLDLFCSGTIFNNREVKYCIHNNGLKRHALLRICYSI
jgi:hypothetical protein